MQHQDRTLVKAPNDENRHRHEDLILDLFKLHVHEKDRDPCRSWIRARGERLPEIIRLLIAEIQSKDFMPKRALAKELSIRIGCSKKSCIRYIYGKSWVPLVFIDTLLQVYQEKVGLPMPKIKEKRKAVQSSIEWLKVGVRNSKPIMAVRFLTPELCKIAGAYAADGTTSKDYIIELCDKDKRAVEAFGDWLGNTFKILVKTKFSSKDNAWKIILCNKVIARYLNIFLGFPYGEKTGIVEEPEIIKRAPQEYRRAFACGVMTFDGSINVRGRVMIELKSHKLRDAVVEIAKNDGLAPDISENNERGHYSAVSPLIKHAKVQKRWLAYFEKGTEKWFMARDFLFGFWYHVDNLGQALSMLDRAYGPQPTTKITLSDGIRTAEMLKIFSTKRFVKKVSNDITSVTALEYLKILQRTNAVQPLKDITLEAFAELLKSPTSECSIAFERSSSKKFVCELMMITSCRSYKELANKLGVPKTSLWYWFSKNGGVPIKKLDEFSALLTWNRKTVLKGVRCIKSRGNLYMYNPNIPTWKIPYRPLD